MSQSALKTDAQQIVVDEIFCVILPCDVRAAGLAPRV